MQNSIYAVNWLYKASVIIQFSLIKGKTKNIVLMFLIINKLRIGLLF